MPQTDPADVDVGRLDVPVHQAGGVGLLQRLADLPQDVNHPLLRERALPPHQGLEVHPFQQLHHEVERTVLGLAEVVQLDGVGRAELGRGLRLAPESGDRQPRHSSDPGLASTSGWISLMAAGRASMRWVALYTSPIPPRPSRLAQLIAPQLPLLGHLPAEAGHHMGDHHGNAEQQVVGVMHGQDAPGGAELVDACGPCQSTCRWGPSRRPASPPRTSSTVERG